jgi:hypothetical protein
MLKPLSSGQRSDESDRRPVGNHVDKWASFANLPLRSDPRGRVGVHRIQPDSSLVHHAVFASLHKVDAMVEMLNRFN